MHAQVESLQQGSLRGKPLRTVALLPEERLKPPNDPELGQLASDAVAEVRQWLESGAPCLTTLEL